MSTKRMLTLRSSDNQDFEVEETVVSGSETIKTLSKKKPVGRIPLPDVTGSVLDKVVEYCKKHGGYAESDEELRKWDAEFVEVDYVVLLDLFWAAKYLNIKSLVDLTCQTIGDLIHRNDSAI